MNEFLKRLTLPSPKFFVKIQNIGYSIILLAAGLKVVAESYEGSKIVNFMNPYLIEIGVMGAIISLIAKLPSVPKEPNPDLTKLQEEKLKQKKEQ